MEEEEIFLPASELVQWSINAFNISASRSSSKTLKILLMCNGEGHREDKTFASLPFPGRESLQVSAQEVIK